MKLVGILLFVAGVVLLIFGINATESFASSVSEVFTGNPTDRSMWLVLGGIVTCVVGAVLFAKSPRALA
ncbi:MAG: DUF3185 family protein [Planctomycetes bacterium]|nr:DUF3185 family protein [Planctomycetota bacterium]